MNSLIRNHLMESNNFLNQLSPVLRPEYIYVNDMYLMQ